jgi:hypothetical protein
MRGEQRAVAKITATVHSRLEGISFPTKDVITVLAEPRASKLSELTLHL